MKSYEDAILNRQEAENDDCKNCKFASVGKCNNQCEKVHRVYNPTILQFCNKNHWQNCKSVVYYNHKI